MSHSKPLGPHPGRERATDSARRTRAHRTPAPRKPHSTAYTCTAQAAQHSTAYICTAQAAQHTAHGTAHRTAYTSHLPPIS
ncbi:hypothetical protein [Streptomyces sp. NBC_01500]|uniref:hypothetical protein n=1 Tax=Streptomyces sp. NBC_01500 TaxID=2903886 RepID=UPI002253108E|nr:hypothetical protein [Streptomyces sp. NBC_01500]MCX4550874.1 hypothetical protein [Streptomyces sp. NBC_01500]